MGPKLRIDKDEARRLSFDWNIRVIYVTRLMKCPFKISEEWIKKYFMYFGPVEDVKLFRKHKHTYAFVKYQYAADAFQALNDHGLNKLMLLRPARIQPIDNTCHIAKLNFDCLYELFSYLDPQDVVSMVQTHEKFKEVADRFYYRYETLDCRPLLYTLLPLHTLNTVFEQIGPYIKELNVFRYNRTLNTADLIEIFAKNCLNVTSLSISFVDFDFVAQGVGRSDEYKNFFKNLKKLELISSNVYDDTIIQLFDGTSNLESLIVDNCRGITGECLQIFTNLKCLRLSYCDELNVNEIHKSFFNKQNLKEFMYCQCYIEYHVIAISMTSALRNLNTVVLTIGNILDLFELDKLLELNFLTTLKLFSYSLKLQIDSFLIKLARKDMLEELVIHHLIISRSTMDALESFKKLKVLTLVQPTNMIYNIFYERLPQVLPALKFLTYLDEKMTFKNVLILIKSLKYLEYMNLSRMYKLGDLWRLVDVLKLDSGRPFFNLVVNWAVLLEFPPQHPLIYENRLIFKITKNNISFDTSFCSGASAHYSDSEDDSDDDSNSEHTQQI